MHTKQRGESSAATRDSSSILKRAAQSLGVASLLLVTNYGQLLGGGADARMHTPFSLTSICLAQLTDLLIVTLVFFALLLALPRLPAYRWTKLILTSGLPVYLVMRSHTLIPQGAKTVWAFSAAAAWALALLLMLWLRPSWYQVALRAASALSACFVLFAALSFVQLIWVAAWAPAPNQKKAAWSAPAEPTRNHPRIVWIIFDELSYKQVYERRAANLNLPHFDELAVESTVFTNVQPVGFKTEKILPSLLSGTAVDRVRYSFSNQVSVHPAGRGNWHRLTGSGTLFGDAHILGWRTAAVGWYNPYCSVYGDALDDCYWMDLDEFDGPMSPTASFRQNVSTPLRQMAREFTSEEKANDVLCDFDVQNRIKTQMDLQAHTFQMLKSDQADLMFVHLGVPHSPNIWNRSEAAFTQRCGSSYLDSLALADKLLGEIMTTLKASPRWPETTLVVEGDHSWRTEVWDGLPAWTAEDARAAAGGFDPRPALIVHRAGQTAPEIMSKPWPLLRIHDLLEKIITNPEDRNLLPHASAQGSDRH